MEEISDSSTQKGRTKMNWLKLQLNRFQFKAKKTFKQRELCCGENGCCRRSWVSGDVLKIRPLGGVVISTIQAMIRLDYKAFMVFFILKVCGSMNSAEILQD